MEELDLSPGALLKHYKHGTLMKVMYHARFTRDASPVVFYIHLDDGEPWVRPIEEFSERAVWPDGVERTKYINVEKKA